MRIGFCIETCYWCILLFFFHLIGGCTIPIQRVEEKQKDELIGEERPNGADKVVLYLCHSLLNCVGPGDFDGRKEGSICY